MRCYTFQDMLRATRRYVLFSYMLYIGYAQSNRSTENCLVSSSIFSFFGGLYFRGHEVGGKGASYPEQCTMLRIDVVDIIIH